MVVRNGRVTVAPQGAIQNKNTPENAAPGHARPVQGRVLGERESYKLGRVVLSVVFLWVEGQRGFSMRFGKSKADLLRARVTTLSPIDLPCVGLTVA